MKKTRLQLEGSTYQRALKGDEKAIGEMFQRFIPRNETIEEAAYLGIKGAFAFGSHSFMAVTKERVAGLEVGPFRGIRYVDAFHEKIVSGSVRQPGLHTMILYVFIAIIAQLFLSTGLVAVLEEADFDILFSEVGYIGLFSVFTGFTFPLVLIVTLRLYFRLSRTGVSFQSRQALVIIFCKRFRMLEAYRMYRISTELRAKKMDLLKLG